MYVRVISPISGQIFQSMVYAKVNIGWLEQYIVYNDRNETFELVDYLDKTAKPVAKPLVYMIQPDVDDFKAYDGSKLLKFKNYCKSNGCPYPNIFNLCGYADICENYAFLCDIFAHRTVPVDRYPLNIRGLPDADQWRYIKTQKDADDFMQLFAGFHDATLESICYTESNIGKKELTAVFDNTEWFGIAELCFEGVQFFKIIPAGENHPREIFDATLHVDDNGVFWADDRIEKPDTSCDCSIIQAHSLKWKAQ